MNMYLSEPTLEAIVSKAKPLPVWFGRLLRMLIVIAVLYALVAVSVHAAYDRGYRDGQHAFIVGG